MLKLVTQFFDSLPGIEQGLALLQFAQAFTNVVEEFLFRSTRRRSRQ